MAQQEEEQKQRSPLESIPYAARIGIRALAPVAAAIAPFLPIILAVIGVILFIVIFIVVILVAIGVIGGGSDAGAVSPGTGLGLKDNYCQTFLSPEDINGDGELNDCSAVLKGIILEAAGVAEMPAGVLIGIGLMENIEDVMVMTEADITRYSEPGEVLPDGGAINTAGKCATSSAGARGPMQFLPGTFEGHKNFIVDAEARPVGYEPEICNIKDNIYAAAHKLKSDTLPFDEPARAWTDAEVILAASTYHWGHPEPLDVCDTSSNYCSGVLEFYERKRDEGIGGTGDPDVPNGCPMSSAFIEGPGNLFGAPRSYGGHVGIDLQGGDGALVVATMDGTVEFSGSDSSAGNQVMIINGPHKIRFIHLYEDLRVSTGERVTRGTVIGRQDNSGTSSEGSHLHYEVYVDGEIVDPTPFIPIANQVGATCEF